MMYVSINKMQCNTLLLLNIPNLMMYVSINCYNISFKIVSVNVRQISSFTFL